MTEHKFGWKPSPPDIRDVKYQAHLETPPHDLPQLVDLSTSPNMPPIYDQGALGSCTANATAGAFDFLNSLSGKGFLGPSRLFQYYMTRLKEGTVSSDAGGTIRDAIKVTNSYGMCPETMWPYDVSKYTQRPSHDCYIQAATHEVAQYLSVNNVNINDMFVCLAAGYPIVFGSTLYESFERTGKDGIVAMPTKDESVIGGHAQLIVGYNMATQYFKVRNSWGTSWGVDGYEFMPFAYLRNPQLANDFWTLRALSVPKQVGLKNLSFLFEE